jgi:hypothetical protein
MDVPILSVGSLITYRQCPRWHDCNAALCPLDPNWRRSVHRQGEAICFYATQSGKAGATEKFAGNVIFAAVVKVISVASQANASPRYTHAI